MVCLSEAQKNLLNKFSDKLSLIPTGINISKFESAKPVKRSELGFSDNDIVLICVAHLVEVKGHVPLIHAISKLNFKYPNLKLLLVGTGSDSYMNSLKELAVSTGAEKNIVFYGNSENVAGLYKMADGKILATQNKGRREAYGAVIIEAMACRLPVIATKSGGPEDLVVDNITGWLVEGLGQEPLCMGIQKFMDAKNKWKSIGEAGYLRAKKYYNLELMISRYSELYSRIADKVS